MGKNSVGRPKSAISRPYSVHLRIGFMENRMLDILKRRLGISRSEVLRRGLEELYGREVKSDEK